MNRLWPVAVALVWAIGPAAWAGERPARDPSIGTLADWHRNSKRATVRDGMLYLDSLQPRGQVRMFRREQAWANVRLEVEFRAEAVGTGVRAVGLVFGSTDSLTYHYVHIDRRNAVLCRSTAEKSWTEIMRRHVPRDEDGRWYTARVETVGTQIKVFFEGKLLYVAKSASLKPGLVGVYAGQARAWVRRVAATGKPARLAKPWQLVKVPEHHVVVCEDAGAGGYEAFPDVCRLKDGRLLAVFYAGYGHVSRPNARLPKGGRVCGCFSADEGRTWGEPFVVVDLDEDDRDPSVTQLPDGTLLCNFFQGREVGRVFVVRSTDGGKTWDAKPVVVEPPPGLDKIYCSTRIFRLPDSTLLLPVYGRTKGVKNYASAFIRSTDGGKTWGDGALVRDDRSHSYGHCEPAVERLPDGKLVCHLRPCMCQTESTDNGRTWTPPHRLGFRGDAPDLLLTSGGVLLSAHRHPGTSLHYSLDGGKTWSENVRLDVVGGAYPSLVERTDGTVLCVYYEEGRGSNIRACRLRVTRDGVKPIPFDTP